MEDRALLRTHLERRSSLANGRRGRLQAAHRPKGRHLPEQVQGEKSQGVRWTESPDSFDDTGGKRIPGLKLDNPRQLAGKAWLVDPQLAFFAVIIADVWQWTPFIVLITLAGLQAVPKELVEAARVDGATWLQIQRFVALPTTWRCSSSWHFS
jgi:hypothetical protein